MIDELQVDLGRLHDALTATYFDLDRSHPPLLLAARRRRAAGVNAEVVDLLGSSAAAGVGRDDGCRRGRPSALGATSSTR